MAIHHLQSGSFLESDAHTGEIPHSLDKMARFVYTGSFKAMDGDVEVTEDKLKSLVDNHNSMLSRLERIAKGDVPVREMPPLQLDHSTSARDTVGRLVGKLELGHHVTEDGEKRLAVLGKVRVLGRENVEKVLDGRWSTLSVGADFEAGKLSELTITPFPAAAEASLLSKKVDPKPVVLSVSTPEAEMTLKEIGQKFKKHLGSMAQLKKLAENDPESKKHLDEMEADMESMGDMEEKEPETHEEMKKRHLEEMEGLKTRHAEEMKGRKLEEYKSKHAEEMEELSKKHAAELKKHGLTEAPAERGAEQPGTEGDEDHKKMSAVREGIKNLTASQDKVRLAMRKSTIRTRLSSLKASMKITPAELKKIDITKLAAENDATMNAVMKSYEDREPVILPGIMGSTSAKDVSESSREARIQRMMAEARHNMPLKKTELENKMKGQSKLSEADANGMNVERDQPADSHHEMEMEALYRLMDEGKIPEAKEHAKKMMDGLRKMWSGEGHDDGAHKEMSELADDFKKMQNQIEDLVKLAGN